MEAESVADIESDAVATASESKLSAGVTDSASSQHQSEMLAKQLGGQYRVIRRNGKVTAFDLGKISVAMTKAFINVEGGTAAASTRIHQTVESLTQQVVNALTRRMPDGGTVHIEDIQDQVELSLMRAGEQKVARAYVIYREERTRERAAETANTKSDSAKIKPAKILVKRADGSKSPLDIKRLKSIIAEACAGRNRS